MHVMFHFQYKVEKVFEQILVIWACLDRQPPVVKHEKCRLGNNNNIIQAKILQGDKRFLFNGLRQKQYLARFSTQSQQGLNL